MKKNQINFCTQPWYNLFVTNNGRIQPCCMNSSPVGNINTDDLQKVWNGAPLQKIRKLISEHNYAEAGCHENCATIYQLKENKTIDLVQKNWMLKDTKDNDTFNQNIIKFQESVKNKKTETLNSPIYFDIQPTEACNMRCIMCHQNHTNPTKISTENLEKLFFDIASLHTIRFQGGEIFVDKNFMPFILKIKQRLSKNQTINIITNGSLLSFADIDMLSSNNPTIKFVVSADGVTEKTFKAIRKSSHFHTVFNTIRYLSKIQKEKQLSDLIRWNFVVMKTNFFEIQDAIKLAAKLDIEIFFQAIIGKQYIDENIFDYKALFTSNMLDYINNAIILSKELNCKVFGIETIQERLQNHAN